MTKLTLQVAASSVAVWGGIRLGWTGSLTVDSVLTIFWLIGVTNAFNLLDNMDGLSAGIAGIVSLTLFAFNFVHHPDRRDAQVPQEQRREHHRDGGADQAGGKAADRACKGNDADESGTETEVLEVTDQSSGE